jgi:hypothetical protein
MVGATGVARPSRKPVDATPSWLVLLRPQQWGMPPASSTHACRPPTVRASGSTVPSSTRFGSAARSETSGSPSRPLVLLPQQYTATPRSIAQEKSSPAPIASSVTSAGKPATSVGAVKGNICAAPSLPTAPRRSSPQQNTRPRSVRAQLCALPVAMSSQRSGIPPSTPPSGVPASLATSLGTSLGTSVGTSLGTSTSSGPASVPGAKQSARTHAYPGGQAVTASQRRRPSGMLTEHAGTTNRRERKRARIRTSLRARAGSARRGGRLGCSIRGPASPPRAPPSQRPGPWRSSPPRSGAAPAPRAP